jgi:tRNA G10  N-methylase Trm11
LKVAACLFIFFSPTYVFNIKACFSTTLVLANDRTFGYTLMNQQANLFGRQKEFVATVLQPPSQANATRNKLALNDRAAHDWYRFVLSFPPHLVREYIQKLGVTQRSVVLDPFCGTGTTVVECKRQSVRSIGIEANPMARFASSVKTDWSPDPEELLRQASSVAKKTRSALLREGIDDNILGEKPKTQLRCLPTEAASLLLTNSICPLPLHKSLVLIEHLQKSSPAFYMDHLKLALARALVSTIGNLHFGPEVGVSAPKGDVSVVEAWLAEVTRMCDDLRELNELDSTPVSVHQTDARQGIRDCILERSIDAVITSPPYPNEKDYTRTTRLESVLLGLIKNKQELRDLKRGLVRSNTRSVYVTDTDDTWIERFGSIQNIAKAIEQRRIELGKTSGFEKLYPRVTKLYFGGMARHLQHLSAVLKPRARLAYVVGDQASYLRVMIRTGQILAEIAESLGYKVLGIDLFRTRLATATKEQLREEVLLLEWIGDSRNGR